MRRNDATKADRHHAKTSAHLRAAALLAAVAGLLGCGDFGEPMGGDDSSGGGGGDTEEQSTCYYESSSHYRCSGGEIEGWVWPAACSPIQREDCAPETLLGNKGYADGCE